MRLLADVPARHAAFVERKSIAALTTPVTSRGWLEYRRPGHLEKVTTEPLSESIMVDGDRLSVVEGQQARVIELQSEPALRALVDAVRGTLAGDLPALQRSYAVAFQGDPAAWRLALTPTDPALAAMLRQVVVEGAGAELRSVRIAQPNGDESLMTIQPHA